MFIQIYCHKETFVARVAGDIETADRLTRTVIFKPKAINALIGVRNVHSSFSETCRLVHRWMSCNLLSDYFPRIALELLVANLFIAPLPYDAPRTPEIAFIRFLKLLSSFDWLSSPLMINFGNKFTAFDISDTHSRFSSEREMLPLMCISTPWDRYSTCTAKSPSGIFLNRAIKTAKACLDHLEAVYEKNWEGFDERILFKPAEDFDVTIHLKRILLSRRTESVEPPNSGDCLTAAFPIVEYLDVDEEKRSLPLAGFDTLDMYLSELRAAFDEFAYFFADRHGGFKVFVLWKVPVFAQKEFKAGSCSGMQSTGSAKKMLMQAKAEAIVEAFTTLGGGMVERVETHCERWRI